MLTFKQFQKISKERNAEYCKYTENWSLGDWGCALAGEAGEACNWIKKYNRRTPDTPEEELQSYKNEAIKELADTISYAFLLAEVLGVDLETIVREKFNEVSDRWDCPIKLTDELPEEVFEAKVRTEIYNNTCYLSGVSGSIPNGCGNITDKRLPDTYGYYLKDNNLWEHTE